MKVSELISALKKQLKERGDVEVVLLTGAWGDCRSLDKEWPGISEVGYFPSFNFEPTGIPYSVYVKHSDRPGKIGICSDE